MWQKLPVNNLEWIEDTFQFNEDFINTTTKRVMKDIFLRLMFSILKNYMNLIMIYHSCLRGGRLKKSKSF